MIEESPHRWLKVTGGSQSPLWRKRQEEDLATTIVLSGLLQQSFVLEPTYCSLFSLLPSDLVKFCNVHIHSAVDCHSDGSHPLTCFSEVQSLALSIGGWKKRSLSLDGAISAFFIGFIHCLCGYTPTVLLVVFFISASMWTKFKSRRKARIETDHREGAVDLLTFC